MTVPQELLKHLILQQQRSNVSDLADSSEQPFALRETVNKLAPPAGTVYCKQQNVTVLDKEVLNWEFPFSVTTIKFPVETITWRTEIYTYVSGAQPSDPQFQGDGGSILIIMVHSGVAQCGVFGGGSTMEFKQKIKCPSSVTPYRQLPSSNTGTQSGDDWNYTMAYEQALALFKNAGNETFTFDALYKEDFTRAKSKQTGSETFDGLEYGVTFQKDVDPNTAFPVLGLSVFKCQTPKVFPATFNFEASVVSGGNNTLASKSVNVKVELNV